MSRVESSAATRSALLNEAAALLDDGGPDAVTLREVGARAGVSRGAPYRHFVGKAALLTAVAADGWERLGEHMLALHSDPQLGPVDTLRAALSAVTELSRRQPHLYQLMFTASGGEPATVVHAAQHTCDEFLAIVATVVGEQEAQRYAAILLTGAHGAAGLGRSGLLRTDKWHTTPDELVDAFIAIVMESDARA